VLSKAPSFLPDREIEICRRVREIRTKALGSQSAFSELVGISRSRLVSYEECRAPVRYDLGKQICYRCNVNQRWFATGAYPKKPYFDLSPNLEFAIRPRALFSTAYDEVLKEAVEQRILDVEKRIGRRAALAGDYEEGLLDNFHLVGEKEPRADAFYVARIIQYKLRSLDEPLLTEYCKVLMEADSDFSQEHPEQPPHSVKNKQQPVVDKYLPPDMIPAMASGSYWPELRRRLRKAMAKHGAKARLARDLRVTRQAVDKWISGASAPSAEIALDLFHRFP